MAIQYFTSPVFKMTKIEIEYQKTGCKIPMDLKTHKIQNTNLKSFENRRVSIRHCLIKMLD